jgi:heme exporter protein C
MREKIIIVLAIVAGGLLAWNMNNIFNKLPDELNQGAIYRIIYFHVPANILGMTGFGLGMLLSIGYLVTKDLRYDALAASVTEVSLVFASIGLATGSIWARIIWGVWWAWDVRLTSWLVCWLIFGGYLMLRRAIDEPIQRAKFAAVVSVFGSVNAYISYKSIEWWNTQHPQPVLSIRNGGGMAEGMEAPIWWNLLALACFSAILVMVRMRQESVAREIDTLRRMAHAQ